MPDYWEAAITGGRSTSSLDPLAVSPSGYLNIEDYLHFMADPHATTLKNTPVKVDLSQFTAGFNNPEITLDGALRGTVTLLGDGHTAEFTPERNFVGVTLFHVSLPYPDGATAHFTVRVCVTTVPN